MPATDVPSYVQGYRFNAANYAGGVFADVSGYGAPITTVTGAPAFAAVDGHEGLVLDNTWHGQFWHPNAWQGTVVAVMRAERLTTGTHTKDLIAFGRAGLSGNQNRMACVLVGNNRRVFMNSQGGEGTPNQNIGDSTIRAWAGCMDQLRNRQYSMLAGGTVSSAGPTNRPNDGIEQAMGSNANGAIIGAFDDGDVTNATADTALRAHLFELHFFAGNPLVDGATELDGYLSELATAYG